MTKFIALLELEGESDMSSPLGFGPRASVGVTETTNFPACGLEVGCRSMQHSVSSGGTLRRSFFFEFLFEHGDVTFAQPDWDCPRLSHLCHDHGYFLWSKELLVLW